MGLSKTLREALKEGFSGKEGGSGTNAGPGRAAVRALMRDAVDAGLSEDEVINFAKPAFYRGTNDPFGGGQLLEDRTLRNLAAYAKSCSGDGTDGQGSTTEAQAAFFKAFPDLQALYIELAG
jgi:hypothetical protein